MRTLLVAVPLLALLALAVWFAGVAWVRLGGEPIPLYGYVAIIGGVFFSLLVGAGLMALVFTATATGMMKTPIASTKNNPSSRLIATHDIGADSFSPCHLVG